MPGLPFVCCLSACPVQECRKVGVECVVAPYEADSQLAYLSKESIVDLVITEDSDLLVFGCKKVVASGELHLCV